MLVKNCAIVALSAIAAGALTAPAASRACASSPVELLAPHEFQVDVPPELGLRFPSRPTKVRVTVGTDGLARNAVVIQSSGDRATDEVGMRMALHARYKAARNARCRPVEGNYLYVEDWQKDAP